MADLDRGSAVIRAALLAHMKKSLNEATVAKDLGIAAETLRGFADKRLTLSPDVMQALTAILFHGAAEYNSQHDLLRAAHRDLPKPMGTAPAAFIPQPVDYPTGPPPLYPPKVGKPEMVWKSPWAEG